MLSKIMSYLFPQKCVSCGKTCEGDSHHYICPECFSSLHPLTKIPGKKCGTCSTFLYNSIKDLCYSCLQNRYYFSHNTSLFYYKEPVIRELVRRMKFLNNKKAAYDLSHLLKDNIRDYLLRNTYDLHLVTPLSRESFKKRGFNQVSMILNLCDIPFTDILYRKSHVKHQSELSADERKESIKNQFQINENEKYMIKDKKILLIDDIFTTGSTVNEVSRILTLNGASSVGVLTFFKD